MTLTALMITIGMMATYHYRADRWGVFARDYQWFHEHILVNKLYLKTNFLIETQHEYTCYVFGSSRVAALDSRLIGERCYNFTHSGGVLSDHLRAVKQLLSAGLPVNKVYIAFDDLSYNVDPDTSYQQHMRRPYPDNYLELSGFLSLFLLKPVDFTDLSLVSGKNPKLEIPRFIRNPDLDTDRIRQKYQKFYDNPKNTNIRFRRLRGLPEGTSYYGEAAVSALMELKILSEQHDFDLRGFFLPLHYKTYLTRNYPWYLEFKSSIAKVMPFQDFTGLNRFTTDNRYWRETSHFSATVGDQLISILLGESSASNEGFGRQVDANNINALEREQLDVDMEYMPLLAKREGMMPIPQRLMNRWDEREMLELVSMRPRPGRRQMMIHENAEVTIRRAAGEENSPRSGTAFAALQRGDYFVIEYELESQRRRMLSVQLSHDEAMYGGKYGEFNAQIKPGKNRGALLAYASVDSPSIRVRLGGGDADIEWQALKTYKINYQDLTELIQGG